jgi:hypothetical protein
MPRHDSIFKALLRSFFADLLWLVAPNLAGRLDLQHPEFLDKEFFTVGGRRRELDLLARVPFLGESQGSLLVHVEVEARATSGMGQRLFLYRNHIQAVHASLILSIVLYLHRGGAGVRRSDLTESVRDLDLGGFRYTAFGLAGCDAAEYLSRPEPLAWGLAALMRRGPLTRPELKLACLRRIAAADLDAARRILLVDCVETYLELNSDEATEYARLSKVRENREVKTMATTWSERIAAQGREEGLQAGLQAGRREGLRAGRKEGQQEALQAVRRILISLLEQRFGPLSDATRERVESISSLDRLTRLSERALTARSLAALRLH